MADNLTTQSATPATIPASSVISTEEVTTLNGGAVSAQHLQRIAAAIRTADGTAVDLPGSTADGLLVNLGANNDVTVTGTVTANIAAGTNNIGDVDVLTLPALPAGTNNIGDVDVLSIAAGDNNIGNVDVVTMPNVTVGTMANLTESLVDDAAFTPATSRVLPVGFEFDDTTPDSVNEGDIGAARMSANRNIYTTIRDAAGNERGANVNASSQLSVSVDNTVTVASHAVTNAGTFAVQESGAALTALQLIDDTIATDGSATPTKGVLIAGQDGTNAQTIKTDTSGELQVDVLTMPTVTETNSAAALTALQLIDNLVQTEDAPAAGGESGVQVLGVRKDTGGTLASLDGDFTPFQMDSSGNLRVNVAAGGAGDGAILDGVSSSIKATVFDYTNSNPVSVRLTDTNGDYVGAGAGTQYTEDAAAAADPVGTALNLIRKDTPASEVSTDGDNIAARGNSAGAQYVELLSGTAKIGGDATNGLKVDITRIAAGTNNIGDVDVLSIAAGDNNIGNVDIVTMANLTESLVDDAAFTPATSRVVPIGFEFDDTTPDSVDEGDIGAARMSANRNIYTTIRDAAGNERGVNVNASNQLAVSVDNTVTVASHAVTNAGTFAVQVDGSALTALQLIDDPVVADDAAFTPATTKVMMAGFEADETSTDSVDEGDGGAARMTLDRKVIVNPQPHTAGGLSIFRSLDLDETEEDVKTSAGQVYGWAVTNTATATRWLKFYNATAANVTVGTTTPVITWGIPGNTSDDVAANVLGAHGIAFDTAICVAATTGVADNDTGAPAANDLIVNIFYK